MSQHEPHKIIRCLAEGVDPLTLNPLPSDSPLQQPYLIRAFFAASSALEFAKERELRRKSLPQNTGKGWSATEEESLVSSFTAGISLKLLASEHQRSTTAIRTRLIKLGKISEFDELN